MMLILTPGSRRKLIRHIREGLDIMSLSEQMDVSTHTIGRLIKGDRELIRIGRAHGLVTEKNQMARAEGDRLEDLAIGLNPEFVRKVWRKRRLQAVADAKAREVEAQKDAIERERQRQHRAVSALMPEIMRVPAKRIIHEVAAMHGLTYPDLVGRSRKLPIVRARHIAIWRVRHERKLSIPAVGQYFGLDHTTVLSALRKINRLIASGELAYLAEPIEQAAA